MIAYQKGDMDAFTGLYEALKRPLIRYLWTFVRNQTMAEDLLQETFLQLHRARQTYTPPRPVRPWIYAITRHVALMHLRSMRRRKEVLPDEDLPEVPVPPEMDQLADRATVQRLLAHPAAKARRRSSSSTTCSGMSFEEVGPIVGIAPGTAKVRAHRALKKIREQLIEEGA